MPWASARMSIAASATRNSRVWSGGSRKPRCRRSAGTSSTRSKRSGSVSAGSGAVGGQDGEEAFPFSTASWFFLDAVDMTAPAGTPEWLLTPRPIDHPQAVAFMEARIAAIHAGTAPEAIWLVEHPPLYTAGTSAATRSTARCSLRLIRASISSTG